MCKEIKTKHGTITLPAFFPTIGWPGGRGEYDFLFKNLEYFCKKINHYHFLFNFSSFIFGFTIPKNDFNSQYKKFKNRDIRDILIENTDISTSIAKSLIILLDVGGNRIFNKIIKDGLSPTSLSSYEKYFKTYKRFIENSNPDIYVNFDIGPAYTTKDEISKKGLEIWNSLSLRQKYEINHQLLKISIKFINDGNLIMVPVNASDTNVFKKSLDYLYNNYANEIDIVAIAGIANSPKKVEISLKMFNEYKMMKKWRVLSHGLGLGGWRNIPYLIKYNINSCDVASPWRRACTNSISHPYLPLFDNNLNFTNIPNSFYHKELYNEIYSKIECNCPFCNDLPLKEIQERCKRADKNIMGMSSHDKDFREMRIRVFFHNVFQHIALMKKLYQYEIKYNDRFMIEFLKEMPEGETKSEFSKFSFSK